MFTRIEIHTFLLVLFCSSFAWAASPTKVLKENQKIVKELVEKRKKAKTTAEKEAIEEKIKKRLRVYIDIKRIAKKTLKNHWKKKKPAEREEFLFWLERLFQWSYSGSMNTRKMKKGEAKVEYKTEKIQGKKAHVFALVKFRKKRRRRWRKVRVNFYFYKNKKKKWMLDDVHTNGNSIVETYQEQFDKIIEKKGWKKLMKLLRKKVNKQRKKRGLSLVEYKKKS